MTTLLVGQTNPDFISFDVVQGQTISFTLENDFQDPVVHFTASKGIVEEMEVSNNLFEVTYTADTDELGEDVFSMQTIHFTGFFPTAELTVVQLNIVKSIVKANDDFIFIEEDQTIEIYPLINDESEDNSHSLLGVTHVMYGDGIVTDSNTIIYTPSDEPLDYINYTIVDDAGSSTTATVYVKRQEDVEAESYQSFTLSNTQSQYIFTESDDYSLTLVGELGSLEQVNDRVFKYQPYSDTEGLDDLTLTSSAGDIINLDLTIYPSDVDDGVVRDDIFFTSKNNSVVFDVFENDFDNSLIIDESETSSELTYLGSGTFTYEPPYNFNGVRSFEYTATNGFITEVGNIDIVVSNFNPNSTYTYEFDVLEGSVLTIPYDIPLAGFSYEVASEPTFGTISYVSEGESFSTICGDIINQNTVVYTPFAGYEGIDEFDLLYCPDNNINPCELIKTQVEVVSNENEDCNCIEGCVWRGDTNNDGLVDILDILSVGRNIGATGIARSILSSWAGESCEDWDYVDSYGVNTKYSDTNGDGHVTKADLSEVIANYGNIHSYAANNSLSVKDYPFFLVPHTTEVEVGETMYIDIILGTESTPVVDLQGISFGINLSATIVDSSSVKVTYPNDGYFVNQSSYFEVMHQPQDGTIHSAAIRTNGSTSNGAGIIATLEFIVEEEIEGVKPPKMRSAAGDLVYDVNVLVSDITIQDGRGFQFAVSPASTKINVEIEEDIFGKDEFVISPNPASNYVELSLSNTTNKIQLTDLLGRTLMTVTPTKQDLETGSLNLNTSTFVDGLYYVTVYTDEIHQTKSLQIVK